MASAPPGATDPLLERVEATWRTLACCRPLLDEELAATATKAMACLDEVAGLLSVLPIDQAWPWLDDLVEVEEMALAIHAHLRADGQ